MKILFNHSHPFSFAHGGFQIQIEQAIAAVGRIGVEWEYLRWWDASQRGDVLHHFGRPQPGLVAFAKKKGLKVVFLDLLTGTGSRPLSRQRLARWAYRLIWATLPRHQADALTAGCYRSADACVANTEWEAFLMSYVMGAPPERVVVVPNGVEPVFFAPPEHPRGKWLVCTATIDPRKRVVELAEAAALAKVPLWVLGKPYSEADPYYQRFQAVVAQNPEWVRYEGSVEERERLAAIYREARGFVLLSTKETRSLSAEEASASGCPLLLGDLPWAHSVFGSGARYCPVDATARETAAHLARFYEEAPRIPALPPPASWESVAEAFRDLYARLLAGQAPNPQARLSTSR